MYVLESWSRQKEARTSTTGVVGYGSGQPHFSHLSRKKSQCPPNHGSAPIKYDNKTELAMAR